MLKKIGHQLDFEIYPMVMNGGALALSEPAKQKQLLSEKEENHERSGQSRPEAGAGARASRRERQAAGCGAPNSTPSIIEPDLQVKYEGELDAVRDAYPGARVWRRPDGIWLLTESTLLPGLQQKALFLTGIPFSPKSIVQSWGFWSGIPLRYPVWIGPRHTNFPHGSICAFHPGDNIWRIGDPIVNLLALYTLWAFRHLHLKEVGRWPGKQVAHIPYERIMEFKEGEFCGCDQYDKYYRVCCREKDLRRDLMAAHRSYLVQTGGIRRPPDSVVNFVRFQDVTPQLGELLPEVEIYPEKFLFKKDPCKRADWQNGFHPF